MEFDNQLFNKNLAGIAELEINAEDLINLVFALSQSEEFSVAALLSFSESIRLQLRELNGNYHFVLKKGENE